MARARSFNLTAEINLRGPANIRAVVSNIRRQLGNINANVNLSVAPNATRNATQLNAALQNLNATLTTTQTNAAAAAQAINDFAAAVNNVNPANLNRGLNNAQRNMNNMGAGAGQARTEMEEFGRQSALAVRRFAAFSAVTSIIFGVTNAIRQGTAAFIEFDKQFIKLQQVTGESQDILKSLSNTITNLSTNLGVSSSELTNVASTLAQAGLSARDTEKALKALALSSLAPSFDDMNKTVEGSIALMRQFSISADDLDNALGSVNAVAAKFAVESSDIIAAIQRTGGVFAAASKGVSEGKDALNEFIAVFTSVRATTRESAETIATGLRTIFTRIQRGGTVEALKEFGINLTDLDGKFVGAYKAVELLSRGLSSIDPRDLKFSQIIEELGGFRQIGKVIPLIQQFTTAQQALAVAQQGQGSLAEDAALAQKSLANQIVKVREEFLALFREIGGTDTFQSLAKSALSIASALIKVADAAKEVLPILSIVMAVRGAQAIRQFGTGFMGGIRRGRASGGSVGYAKGGMIDVALMPGEGVVYPDAVKSIGVNTLRKMNYADKRPMKRGGAVKLARGGVAQVPGEGNTDSFYTQLPAGSFVIRKDATSAIGIDNISQIARGRQKFGIGGVTIAPKIQSAAKYVRSHVTAPKKITDSILEKIKNYYSSFNKSIPKKFQPMFSSSAAKGELTENLTVGLPREFNEALKRGSNQVILLKDFIQSMRSPQFLRAVSLDGKKISSRQKKQSLPALSPQEDAELVRLLQKEIVRSSTRLISDVGPYKKGTRVVSSDTQLHGFEKIIKDFYESKGQILNRPMELMVNQPNQLRTQNRDFLPNKLSEGVKDSLSIHSKIGGLIQKFGVGSDAPLKDMGRADLLKESLRLGVNVPGDIRRLLDPRAKGSEQARSQLIKKLEDQRIITKAKRDKISQQAKKRNIAVVGLTGEAISEEVMSPDRKGKKGKKSIKGFPATLQTGSLPDDLSKQVQAVIRNQSERIAATVGKLIATRAGSSPVTDRKQIRAIVSKQLDNISGLLFESGLAVAGAPYDPSSKALDFGKGLGKDLGSLFGVDPKALTDATKQATKEVARAKVAKGQFTRGRRDIKAKKLRRALGGFIGLSRGGLPLIDDLPNAPGSMLPIPGISKGSPLYRIIKNRGGALDFDRTLQRTVGDAAYASAKTPEQKDAVLDKYFRDPQARLDDVKSARLTQFGQQLQDLIKKGVIKPQNLSIISKSSKVPGLAEHISKMFSIPTSNMEFTSGGSKVPVLEKFSKMRRTPPLKRALGGAVHHLAGGSRNPISPTPFSSQKASAALMGRKQLSGAELRKAAEASGYNIAQLDNGRIELSRSGKVMHNLTRDEASELLGSLTLGRFTSSHAMGGEVPIMAQSGEYIINRRSARAIGYNNLHQLNKYHSGGKVGAVTKLAAGGGPLGSTVSVLSNLLRNFTDSIGRIFSTVRNMPSGSGWGRGGLGGFGVPPTGTNPNRDPNRNRNNSSPGQNSMFALSMAIPMLTDMLQGGEPGSEQAARSQAGNQGMANAVGTGLVLSSMGGPLGWIAGAAAAGYGLVKSFADAENAAKTFAITASKNTLENSLERATQSLDKFTQDVKNDALQIKAKTDIMKVVSDAENVVKQTQRTQYGIMNLADTGQGSYQRGEILQREGIFKYLSTIGIGGESNQSIAFQKYIPELSKQASKSFQGAAEVTTKYLETRFKTGSSVAGMQKENPAEFDRLTRSLALADAAVQQEIMSIDNLVGIGNIEKQQRKESVIAMASERKARDIQTRALREKAIEDLNKSANRLVFSFERMFQNMEQAINRASYAMSLLTDQAEASAAALSGQAKISPTKLTAINTIQNPQAYSNIDRKRASSLASSSFGSQSNVVRGLLEMGPKLEETIMSTINNVLSSTTRGTITNEAMGAKITSAINNALQDLQLPSDLTDKLSTEIGLTLQEMRKQGEDKVDFSQLMEKIPQLSRVLESAKRAQEAATKALENWQNGLNEYAQTFNTIIESQIESNNRYRRATDIEINGRMELARTFGANVDLTGIISNFKASIKQMTGGLSSPVAIGNKALELENVRQARQATANTAANKGPSGMAEFQLMTNQLLKTNVALRDNYDALKRLSESSDIASAAMSKITEIQQKQQAGVAILEKVVTSMPEDIAAMNQAAMRLNENMAGRVNAYSTPETRQQSLELFNMIAPFLGEKEGALKANVLESMLKESNVAIGPMFQNILDSLRNPKADPEMARAISIYEQSLNTQKIANEQLARIDGRMRDNSAAIAAQKLKEALVGTTLNFESRTLVDIRDGINDLVNLVRGRNNPAPAQGIATGGLVYASQGAFIPQGTDTVPAMLTKGEFVVNRQSTQNNLPLLHSINRSKGGKVSYYADGGYVFGGKNNKSESWGKKEHETDTATKETGTQKVDYPLLKNLNPDVGHYRQSVSTLSNPSIYASADSTYRGKPLNLDDENGLFDEPFKNTARVGKAYNEMTLEIAAPLLGGTAPTTVGAGAGAAAGYAGATGLISAGVLSTVAAPLTIGIGAGIAAGTSVASFLNHSNADRQYAGMTNDPKVNPLGFIPKNNINDLFDNNKNGQLKKDKIDKYKKAYDLLLKGVFSADLEENGSSYKSGSGRIDSITDFSQKINPTINKSSNDAGVIIKLSNLTKHLSGNYGVFSTEALKTKLKESHTTAKNEGYPFNITTTPSQLYGRGYATVVAGFDNWSDNNAYGQPFTIGFDRDIPFKDYQVLTATESDATIRSGIVDYFKYKTRLQQALANLNEDKGETETKASTEKRNRLRKMKGLFNKTLFKANFTNEDLNTTSPVTLYNINPQNWKDLVPTFPEFKDKPEVLSGIDGNNWIKITDTQTGGFSRDFPWSTQGFDENNMINAEEAFKLSNKKITVKPDIYEDMERGLNLTYKTITGPFYDPDIEDFSPQSQTFSVIELGGQNAKNNPFAEANTVNSNNYAAIIPGHGRQEIEKYVTNLIKTKTPVGFTGSFGRRVTDAKFMALSYDKDTLNNAFVDKPRTNLAWQAPIFLQTLKDLQKKEDLRDTIGPDLTVKGKELSIEDVDNNKAIFDEFVKKNYGRLIAEKSVRSSTVLSRMRIPLQALDIRRLPKDNNSKAALFRLFGQEATKTKPNIEKMPQFIKTITEGVGRDRVTSYQIREPYAKAWSIMDVLGQFFSFVGSKDFGGISGLIQSPIYSDLNPPELNSVDDIVTRIKETSNAIASGLMASGGKKSANDADPVLNRNILGADIQLALNELWEDDSGAQIASIDKETGAVSYKPLSKNNKPKNIGELGNLALDPYNIFPGGYRSVLINHIIDAFEEAKNPSSPIANKNKQLFIDKLTMMDEWFGFQDRYLDTGMLWPTDDIFKKDYLKYADAFKTLTFGTNLVLPDFKKLEQIRANQELVKMQEAEGKSHGGVVYASKGAYIDFQPKGEDKIPAMLSKGEFVVNKQATQQNLPLLHSINSGSYNRGGVVNGPTYFQDGGQVASVDPFTKKGNSPAYGNRDPNEKGLLVQSGDFERMLHFGSYPRENIQSLQSIASKDYSNMLFFGDRDMRKAYINIKDMINGKYKSRNPYDAKGNFNEKIYFENESRLRDLKKQYSKYFYLRDMDRPKLSLDGYDFTKYLSGSKGLITSLMPIKMPGDQGHPINRVTDIKYGIKDLSPYLDYLYDDYAKLYDWHSGSEHGLIPNPNITKSSDDQSMEESAPDPNKAKLLANKMRLIDNLRKLRKLRHGTDKPAVEFTTPTLDSMLLDENLRTPEEAADMAQREKVLNNIIGIDAMIPFQYRVPSFVGPYLANKIRQEGSAAKSDFTTNSPYFRQMIHLKYPDKDFIDQQTWDEKSLRISEGLIGPMFDTKVTTFQNSKTGEFIPRWMTRTFNGPSFKEVKVPLGILLNHISGQTFSLPKHSADQWKNLFPQIDSDKNSKLDSLELKNAHRRPGNAAEMVVGGLQAVGLLPENKPGPVAIDQTELRTAQEAAKFDTAIGVTPGAGVASMEMTADETKQVLVDKAKPKPEPIKINPLLLSKYSAFKDAYTDMIITSGGPDNIERNRLQRLADKEKLNKLFNLNDEPVSILNNLFETAPDEYFKRRFSLEMDIRKFSDANNHNFLKKISSQALLTQINLDKVVKRFHGEPGVKTNKKIYDDSSAENMSGFNAILDHWKKFSSIGSEGSMITTDPTGEEIDIKPPKLNPKAFVPLTDSTSFEELHPAWMRKLLGKPWVIQGDDAVKWTHNDTLFDSEYIIERTMAYYKVFEDAITRLRMGKLDTPDADKSLGTAASGAIDIFERLKKSSLATQTKDEFGKPIFNPLDETREINVAIDYFNKLKKFRSYTNGKKSQQLTNSQEANELYSELVKVMRENFSSPPSWSMPRIPENTHRMSSGIGNEINTQEPDNDITKLDTEGMASRILYSKRIYDKTQRSIKRASEYAIEAGLNSPYQETTPSYQDTMDEYLNAIMYLKQLKNNYKPNQPNQNDSNPLFQLDFDDIYWPLAMEMSLEPFIPGLPAPPYHPDKAQYIHPSVFGLDEAGENRGLSYTNGTKVNDIVNKAHEEWVRGLEQAKWLAKQQSDTASTVTNKFGIDKQNAARFGKHFKPSNRQTFLEVLEEQFLDNGTTIYDKENIGNLRIPILNSQVESIKRLVEPQGATIPKALGGKVFANGGMVNVALTPGEAVVDPALAQSIGTSTLKRMNHADKKPMNNGGRIRLAQGGIALVPGQGNSDSFKTQLPEGSFVIRKAATSALGMNNSGSTKTINRNNGGIIPRRPIRFQNGGDVDQHDVNFDRAAEILHASQVRGYRPSKADQVLLAKVRKREKELKKQEIEKVKREGYQIRDKNGSVVNTLRGQAALRAMTMEHTSYGGASRQSALAYQERRKAEQERAQAAAQAAAQPAAQAAAQPAAPGAPPAPAAAAPGAPAAPPPELNKFLESLSSTVSKFGENVDKLTQLKGLEIKGSFKHEGKVDVVITGASALDMFEKTIKTKMDAAISDAVSRLKLDTSGNITMGPGSPTTTETNPFEEK